MECNGIVCVLRMRSPRSEALKIYSSNLEGTVCENADTKCAKLWEKPPITVEKPVEKGKEHVNEAGAEPNEPNNAVEKSSQ